MNYIVFDLEKIVCRSEKQFGYIVEIGAVKIIRKKDELKIVDSFQMYIKPPDLKKVTKSTLRFIGADIGCFIRAPRIDVAFRRFKTWINEENYILCGWSDGDLWILAKNKAKNKTVDVSWVKNFNDIQPFVSEELSNEKGKAISLKKAMEMSDIDSGEQNVFHSALADAQHTANLFIKYFDKIQPFLIDGDKNPFSVVSSPIMKICKICKKEKHHTKFALNFNRCKPCNYKRVAEKRKKKQESEDALYALGCGYAIYQEENQT